MLILGFLVVQGFLLSVIAVGSIASLVSGLHSGGIIKDETERLLFSRSIHSCEPNVELVELRRE